MLQVLMPAAEHEPETRGACLAGLPFDNFSNQKGHDYFSIGLVDDLIADHSHFPSLPVMASYTSRILSEEVVNWIMLANPFNHDSDPMDKTTTMVLSPFIFCSPCA